MDTCYTSGSIRVVHLPVQLVYVRYFPLQNGQLGIGSTTNANTAPASDCISSVSDVAPGALHTCVVLTSSGGVRRGGGGGTGQLGTGSTSDVIAPPATDVAFPSEVCCIAVGLYGFVVIVVLFC